MWIWIRVWIPRAVTALQTRLLFKKAIILTKCLLLIKYHLIKAICARRDLLMASCSNTVSCFKKPLDLLYLYKDIFQFHFVYRTCLSQYLRLVIWTESWMREEITRLWPRFSSVISCIQGVCVSASWAALSCTGDGFQWLRHDATRWWKIMKRGRRSYLTTPRQQILFCASLWQVDAAVQSDCAVIRGSIDLPK